MLNYLIAILTTVYSMMLGKGDFSYKSNKYRFIERYSIAMQDEWGYAELVIHPPPINVLTFFLLPMVIRKSLMRNAAEVFSKFIFWLENIIYIFLFLSYELMLVPFIFLRVIFNIVKLASFLNMILLTFLWIIIGLFYLLYGVFKDMFFFAKILCDYKDEEDQRLEKEEEDSKQDKIVIYNEVLDVMRSILFLFK